jgi:zinc transport system substrate-binding protein
MNRSLIVKVAATAVLVIALAAGIFFAANQDDVGHKGGKLSVATTFYPLYEFTKQVGGDKVSVINITPAGAEPHDYEPPAKALVAASKADVFVYNGGTFEPWTEKFVKDYKNTTVKASNGIRLAAGETHDHDDEQAEDAEHDHEDAKDPHFWLDPVLAQHVIVNIREGLSKADPGNKAYYQQRAEEYISKLKQLDQEYATGLQSCRLHTIVASHGAFSYVASRYGFTVEAITGLSPETEPSASRLAELTEHVKEEGISHIFFEHLVSTRLADTIAQETGAQTLVLDPIEGLTNEAQKDGKDYLSIQRENLRNLRTALACK